MAVLLPDPAGPVRNISNCSLASLAFNHFTISVVSFDDWPPNLCCRQMNKVVFESSPSFTRPRRKVHAIISCAMYCFSSSCVFSSFAFFLLYSAVLVPFYCGNCCDLLWYLFCYHLFLKCHHVHHRKSHKHHCTLLLQPMLQI